VVDTVSTSENTELENLTRYLIGVHHGYGRPLFPTPPGEQTPDTVEGSIFGDNIKVDSVYDHYELGSEWSDLFWKFTEQYGPWSLAYLESFIRIADQEVSRDST
jgi:CRISPR-associated endonuclease/helicase Cas3